MAAEHLGADDVAQYRMLAIEAFERSRSILESQIDLLAHAMEGYARRLPVWPWVEQVQGFGAIGLAMIVGETSGPDGERHLSHYATPARVWKRMCVGMVQRPDGKWHRQRKFEGLSEMEAYEIGYKPSRRSIMYQIGDSLLKGNHVKMATEIDEDGKAHGVYEDLSYRALYVARRAIEDTKLPPDAPARKLIIHRRAQRYVEKRLLRDLWRAWRVMTPCEDMVPSETEAWAESA
jgi:hypothetical protein